MSLKARVKVGGVTSLSEARYCAGMGVELLGFPVGTGGLTPEQYKQIIDWLSGPELILEASHSSTLHLSEITAAYPGHYIQINTGQISWLQESDLKFIVSINASEWPALKAELTRHRNIAFVDLHHADIQDAVEIGKNFPVLFNAESTNLESIIASKVAGISLAGSREERPGLQDYSKLAEVLEQLEED